MYLVIILEVTNSHKHKVPEPWIRKQTLTNAERYITPELKEYEEKIMGAEEKIQLIEAGIYEKLMLELQDYIAPDAGKRACAGSFGLSALFCRQCTAIQL